MDWAAFAILSFLCGSIPFSVWLGKLFLGVDVRRLGDGNPGATNAFRTGNRWIGLLVLLLDISKAAAPVGIAYFTLEYRGGPMFVIGIAPVLGHVFSPFLRFRGGKAVAAAFGVWIGLTIWKASLPGVLAAVLGLALFTPSGWAVMAGLGAILLVLLVALPDPMFLAVWAAETLLLAWTHRADLAQRPQLRAWLAKRRLRGRAQPM